MNDKGTANSKKEKLFFTDFVFISGEHEQHFVKLFYAKGKKDLKKKLHDYLIDYYGKGDNYTISGDVYINVLVEMRLEYIEWTIKNYINNNQKSSNTKDIQT